MILSNEKIYDMITQLYRNIESTNTLTIILGMLLIAEIIAIILIGKETEKLAKKIKQIENKKSLDNQGTKD